MAYLLLCTEVWSYLKPYFVFGVFVHCNRSKHGQTSCSVTRAKIQTSGNFEKNTYKFDCFLAIVACFFVNFLLNSSNVVACKGRW